jgi:ribose transport system permease protein
LSYRWPTFLKADNLLNVANQIAVVAIIAIGMALVIVTGGIDLSVGSLIALSAVGTAIIVRDHGGGASASNGTLLWAVVAGVLACGAVGPAAGALVTRFRIPPFIVTLGFMMIASGEVFSLARGNSIYDVPDRAT